VADEQGPDQDDPEHGPGGEQRRRRDHDLLIGRDGTGFEPLAAKMAAVSWLFIALLACAIGVLIAAEWPRLARRMDLESRERRSRSRRKAKLKVVRSESEEFEASVQRDLENLPTIEEHDRRR
jgi:hypothetical protein